MAAIGRLMFREYDIRGRVSPQELNSGSVELIAKAYGTFLRDHNITDVVLGHDSRHCSEDFHHVALQGLISTGCDVIDLGMVLTPMMYWAQYHFGIEGGVMITGSHNPKGWSGFKLALGYSYTLIGEELEELYQLIVSDSFASGRGSVARRNVIDTYAEDILSRVDITRPLKVVVDAGNGTAGAIVPDILRKAGMNVVEQFCELDPDFPNHEPDPDTVATVQALGDGVRRTNADLGFAFDGDGDRLGLVDERGQGIWPDRYLILLARQVLQKKPGAKIIYDVKCSQALEEDIRAHGGVPIIWKTGHSHIKRKLQIEEGALAGEMSGHMFFSEGYYGFDDAVFASLKLLEYFSSQDVPLSEIIAGTPYYIATPTIHVDCPDDKKYAVIEDITNEFKEKYSVIDINGARVNFGDGWGLVRASSNLPQLTLRFEAKSQERLEEIKEIFRQTLGKFESVGKKWKT